jgi:two-component system NtrC family sensor kinase
VVDDEEAIREFLQESLALEGFAVDVAQNAEEGLTRLRARHYDLVLCDIKMPGKTGIELLEEISREQPDIVSRFIFMTGDALSPGTREVLDSAVVHYLMKPFTLADVLRLLSEPS